MSAVVARKEQCPLCGFGFDAEGQGCRPSCPMAKGCRVICCPSCGYTFPQESGVALVTVTLFIPCIANFFMILKERGWRTGVAMLAFILPFSFGVGAAVNQLMRLVHA